MGLLYLSPLKGTAFSPNQISGLRVWLDASLASSINAGSPADNDPVSTWTDRSTNAYSFTAAGGLRPTYKTNIQNSKPVIRGAASTIGATVGADLTVFSLFVVTSVTTFRQFDCILGSNSLSTGQATLELGLTSQFDVWDGNVGAVMNTGIGTAPTSTFQILNVAYTSGSGTFYIGNVSKATTAQASMFLESANMNLFDDGSTSFTAYRGDIAEVVIYDSVLSTSDRGNVYTYLKTKWGL